MHLEVLTEGLLYSTHMLDMRIQQGPNSHSSFLQSSGSMEGGGNSRDEMSNLHSTLWNCNQEVPQVRKDTVTVYHTAP